MSGCGRCRPMAPPRAPRRWPTARPISPSSAAISRCRRMRRPWRRCARTSRCSGCRRPPRSRARRPLPKITKIAQLAGHRVGVVGRTQANVNLLKVILQQYGVDPAKVEIVQFPATEAADAIRSQKADAYLAAGPVNSKITADAIAPRRATAARRPSSRSIPPRRSRKIIRCTKRPKFPPAPSAARPPGPTTR